LPFNGKPPANACISGHVTNMAITHQKHYHATSRVVKYFYGDFGSQGKLPNKYSAKTSSKRQCP